MGMAVSWLYGVLICKSSDSVTVQLIETWIKLFDKGWHSSPILAHLLLWFLLGWASNPNTSIRTTKIPVGTEKTITTTADSFTAHVNCYPAFPSHPHLHVVICPWSGFPQLGTGFIPISVVPFPIAWFWLWARSSCLDRISIRFQPDGLWSTFSFLCSWLQPHRRLLQPNRIKPCPSGSWASCLILACNVIILYVPYNRYSTQTFCFAPEIWIFCQL